MMLEGYQQSCKTAFEYANGIDSLIFTRNARTSVEMIERFYSFELMAKMNNEMLHSKRSKAG
jgi:hypothetical protein